MRSARWLFVLAALVLCAGVAHADGINPPDGNIGIQNGSQSVSITTLNFNFAFVLCSTATGANATECATLGEPQAFFDGKNDTGIPWTSLDLTITFPQTATVETFPLGCDGFTFFTISNCGENVSTSTTGPTTVNVDFQKGTGTGIGCYDTTDSGAAFGCFFTSLGNYLSGNGAFDNPDPSFPGAPPCATDPNEVCGGYDFIVEVGFNGLTFPTDSIPTGGTAVASDVTPEPSSLILFGGGLLGLAGLIRKKLRS